MSESFVPAILQLRPGLALTLREAGHGSPVLLLHGAAGPDSTSTLLAHLAGHRQVLAPTHPGWDNTARPDSLASVADLAAAYLDLLERRAADAATVVGVSFGGWVAAQMAVTDQDRRINRLVLIDSIGPQFPDHPPTMPPGAPPSPSGASLRQGPPPGNMAAFRAYGGQALGDPELLNRVRQLRVPALLVWGENDTTVTPTFGRLYAEALPDSRFVLIPGAGHLPMRENPAATFAAVDAFLSETELPRPVSPDPTRPSSDWRTP